MVKRMYSVFDCKSKVYSAPFFVVHDGEALRMFGDAVADKDTALSRHPEDYTLFRVGEFDDNSGAISSYAQPEYLAKALDFVKV